MHHKKWPEGNRIERNVIVTTDPIGTSLRYHVPAKSTVIANNLIWSANGKLGVDYEVLEEQKTVGGATWAQWVSEGIEIGSVVADPCMVIRNNKLTTCPESPAKTIGFKPIPDDMGLIQ